MFLSLFLIFELIQQVSLISFSDIFLCIFLLILNCSKAKDSTFGLLRGLPLQNISGIFPQSCISHHGCRKVSNLWCWDFWKIHLSVKQLNLFIFAYVPEQNSPQGRSKLPISPKQGFLKIYFLPSRKRQHHGT